MTGQQGQPDDLEIPPWVLGVQDPAELQRLVAAGLRDLVAERKRVNALGEQLTQVAGLARAADGQPLPASVAEDITGLATLGLKRLMGGEAAGRWHESMKRAGRPQPQIRTGAYLTGQTFDPIRWVVPGLIPEGVTIPAGGKKCGKSWLVLSVGLSLSSGRPVLGALPGGLPRPVLYLALEDSDRRLKDRCGQLGYDQIPGLFSYVTECHPDDVLPLITSWLAETGPGRQPLVIIDVLAKILPPAQKGETTYERDYRVGSSLKSIAAGYPGLAIVINHHTRKERAEDFVDAVGGTGGVTGSADTVMVLVRKRGEATGQLHVTGRDVTENVYQLTGFPYWAMDGGSLGAAAQAAAQASLLGSLGDRSASILAHAQQAGSITTAKAGEILGVGSSAASAYLGRLVQSGRLQRNNRGEYSYLHVGSVVSVGNGYQYPTLPTNTTGGTGMTGDPHPGIGWWVNVYSLAAQADPPVR